MTKGIGMLLIKTEIRFSNIHGLGCFSLQNIKKGQKLWIFDPRIDTRFDVKEINSLPDVVIDYVKTYGYQEIVNGKHVVTLCGDNAKYMNHSDTPNVITSNDDKEFEIAAIDLKIGDELTSNYRAFDLDIEWKLHSNRN
jgi:SET domain-containing protein